MAKNLYLETREKVAEEIHNIWLDWSREIHATEKLSEKRIIRWNTYCWLPYAELNRKSKEVDRQLADRILDKLFMMQCPIYQCGGLMKAVERPYPEGKNEDDFAEGMPGDNQTPDLICTNCHALYEFKRFKK